jgi:hypothetical protein
MKKAIKTLIKENSCKTVPFVKRAEAQKLIDAALHFFNAALWTQKKFRDNEIKAIKNILPYYLQDDSFLRKCFTIFNECIVLYKKHFADEPVLHPLVWLNQGYGGGFTKALQYYRQAQEIRKAVSLYENSISVLANIVLKYTKKLTPSKAGLCRSSLLFQKDETLLKLFYFTLFTLITSIK